MVITMKSMKKWSCLLRLLAGFLFILSAFLGKDWVFLPIGLCFVALGVMSGIESGKD